MFLGTDLFSNFLTAISWRGCAGEKHCFGASRLGSYLNSMAGGEGAVQVAWPLWALVYNPSNGETVVGSSWHIVGAH